MDQGRISWIKEDQLKRILKGTVAKRVAKITSPQNPVTPKIRLPEIVLQVEMRQLLLHKRREEEYLSR